MRRIILTFIVAGFVGWGPLGPDAASALPTSATVYPLVCPGNAVADAQAGCVCTEAGFQYDKASNRCVEPTPCRSANAEGTTGPTGPLVYSSPPPSNGRGRTASPGYQWGQYDVRTCSSTPPGNTNGSSVKPSRKSPAGTSQ
ncbi:MAG: hypothetical protein K1X35_06640 [Caulobacteraceae bacterium]|nr:hypothetical protein [Caulobacteraceae bacterium]